MVRLLLLLYPSEGDFQAHRGVEQLARGLGAEFDVQVASIGRGATLGHPLLALRRLRRMAQFDLVHTFGARALTLAALAGRWPLVHTPEVEIDRRGARWLRSVMSHRSVQVLCSSSAQRRALVGSGTELERCHLVRPGVDFARVKPRRSAELRRQLGLGEQDYVLLAAGATTRAAGHISAAWATSMLHVLDARWKLLLWGEGPAVARLETFLRRMGNPRLLHNARVLLGRRVEFEELLPASDMILAPATGPVATLPIAIGMAAGLPIVGAATYTVSELLEDRHTALLVPPGATRLLAQKIIELREDARLQWQLADMSRTEAYEYFALTRFIQQHRSAYQQVIEGGAVEILEPQPGAGRRFHGRA